MEKTKGEETVGKSGKGGEKYVFRQQRKKIKIDRERINKPIKR